MAAEPVRAEVEIAAPPERVFEYFVRPEALARWMGERAVVDAIAGGRFELDVDGARVRGRIVEIDVPHRVVFTWGYAGSAVVPPGASTVEVRLAATPGGTLVVLEHRDLPASEDAGHRVGWGHYLGRLALAGRGADPGPDPGMPHPGPAPRAPR